MSTVIKIKLLIVIALFFSSFSVFSQKKLLDSLFSIEISRKAEEFKTEKYFTKATSYFIQEEWDSTLVYSMKQLSLPNLDNSLLDYCHFFRAYSFKQKKLLIEAQNEFSLVSTKFVFHYFVKIYFGEIALEQNKYKKAIPYFLEVENLPKDKEYFFNKSTVQHNLGLCYLHLEEFDKAEFYLLESVKLQEEQNDSVILVGSYGDIAGLYYEQYKDNLAIPYFEKAYNLSKKIKDFQLKQNSALNMAVVEENRKNFPKALVYRKEYEQWRDSLNDQNKIWQVAQLEKQFAVKEKQKEVSLLQAENKIKIAERNGFFYSAIVLLLLLGTSFYFYREKIKTNKVILAQKETLDELNATKDKLFSIVSHDLRSSVNAMKTSNAKLLENLETKNLEELDSLLHQNSAIANGTYNLLDNLLHWALLQTKQSYFEIIAMRLFFIVEQVAYNYQSLLVEKNIHLENIVLKSDMVFADQESLKIILRNLLDNAIKFSNENGVIKIYTQNNNDTFCELVIEDNGIGMTEPTRFSLLKETTLLAKKANENTIGTGLGMQLCKSMIQKNKGKLNIESEFGKGTKMIVSLLKTPPNG
ncbi:sensor histidine kinase [Flavobacterium jejuense]|uniref:histidine kinase n=1 Tax=Flavobacterium jejuense TaxID=1544455 RepID=A0ABX0IVC2_9FLAO|nr:tetratricopeptide repeat-containing sensor histidine kinase [Flavobacterium jejuense]NHN27860.1 sensor histidine kinase [Flavobacterium jejuense]